MRGQARLQRDSTVQLSHPASHRRVTEFFPNTPRYEILELHFLGRQREGDIVTMLLVVRLEELDQVRSSIHILHSPHSMIESHLQMLFCEANGSRRQWGMETVEVGNWDPYRMHLHGITVIILCQDYIGLGIHCFDQDDNLLDA